LDLSVGEVGAVEDDNELVAKVGVVPMLVVVTVSRVKLGFRGFRRSGGAVVRLTVGGGRLWAVDRVREGGAIERVEEEPRGRI
jgi:hypothetical protein